MHDFSAMAERVISDLGGVYPLWKENGEQSSVVAVILRRDAEPGSYGDAYIPKSQERPEQGMRILNGNQMLEIVRIEETATHWVCGLRKRSELR